MLSVLGSKSSGPGLNTHTGGCDVFSGKTLYSRGNINNYWQIVPDKMLLDCQS